MSLSRLIGPAGVVEFNAIREEIPEYQNLITSHPVENGSNVSDHVSVQSDILPISGRIVGPDAPVKLRRLKEFRRKKQLLTYIGRNFFSRVVIQNISTRHNAGVRDGFDFEMQLHQIRIAVKTEVQVTAAAPTQVRKTQNAGKQQPQTREPFFTFTARNETAQQQAIRGSLPWAL